ncbi:hypothetical protein F2Q68_00018697 [Brassica cretica]|uniref:Uncharacterized protein n=1 Tax=Brassica cretica TaxID=69181 RepID=A0A8S9G4K8_BRACR|nr:hypothetical protein F2Q68_00018697 [Brassica cretica]
MLRTIQSSNKTKKTKVLDAKEQIEARDMYWEAVSSDASKEGYLERAEERLLVCIEKNPFVGEPHVLLSQVYLGRKRFLEAEREAERGLVLLLQWGSPWDKRMSWEGWIAWVRVLLMKSSDQSWPDVSWGDLELGSCPLRLQFVRACLCFTKIRFNKKIDESVDACR